MPQGDHRVAFHRAPRRDVAGHRHGSYQCSESMGTSLVKPTPDTPGMAALAALGKQEENGKSIPRGKHVCDILWAAGTRNLKRPDQKGVP